MIKGFRPGDKIEDTRERYLIVTNASKTFIIADNGERRQQIVDLDGNMTFNPPLNKPAL